MSIEKSFLKCYNGFDEGDGIADIDRAVPIIKKVAWLERIKTQ